MRVVRNDDSTTTVVAFPRGWRSGELIGSLVLLGWFLALLVMMTHAVLSTGAAPGARALGVVLGIFFLLLIAFGTLMAGMAFEWAFSQVEFDVGPDGLFYIASWRFGVKQRRWSRGEVVNLRVVPQRTRSISELAVVPAQGPEERVLRTSTSAAQEVAAVLRESLGLASEPSQQPALTSVRPAVIRRPRPRPASPRTR